MHTEPPSIIPMAVRPIQPHKYKRDGLRFSLSLGERAGVRESVLKNILIHI